MSSEQININNVKFSENSRLEFIAADAFDWVKENGRSNIFFVTSRGVLEYFTESRLKEFIKSLDNVLFVAIEPNVLTHNFELNPNSEIYGIDFFLHNYQKIFNDSDFNILHHSKKELLECNCVMNYLLAKN